MELSVLVLGIVIGAVGAFGTGFLKKAGEDTYSAIKKKLFPKSVEKESPQVVINFQGKEPVEPILQAPVEVEHLSGITFGDIEKAIEGAPPLQQKGVALSYVGIKVEWITFLRSANKTASGEVSLRLSIDEQYQGRCVLCKVPESEYRELNVLPKGSKIRVSGEISVATIYDIELTDVRLQILPRSNA